MVVLETMDISPEGNIARYVITVTQTTIKTVDSNGYPHYYDRNSGKLKLSAQSSRTMNDRVLHGLTCIEQYIARHGYSPVALGRLTWNGGLRPYLKISIVRASSDDEKAKSVLVEEYDLTEDEATLLLDMTMSEIVENNQDRLEYYRTSVNALSRLVGEKEETDNNTSYIELVTH